VNELEILTVSDQIFATAFMPHGTCYLWKPGLVGLHLVSDLIIALSYFSIPVVLVKLVSQRHDIPFDWLFSLFAAFIVFCGMGHLMDIWTLWHPDYWLSGYIRALTALVSVGTATVLVIFFPQILRLPSPMQMEEKNRHLSREIQERQRVEIELRKERQFLQALLANLSDGIVACDPDGVLTLFNQATQEFHGLPMEPIAAEDWGQYYDLYHADGKTPLNRSEIPLFRSLQGESVRDVEMSIVPKQGKIRYILANGDPILTPEGEKLGAVVAMHDISERKIAEALLQEREEFLSSIYNGVELSIFVIDVTEDGDFHYVGLNPAHERLTGLTSREIQGKTPEEVLAPDDAATVRAHYLQCYQARTAITYEECLPFKNKPTWWLTSLKPLRNDNLQIDRIVGTSLNITQRKQVEAELRDSERRFYGAFEYAAIGKALVAPDGRWLRVNRALCDIVGYRAEELLKIDFQSITHADDLDTDLDYVRQILAGELSTYQMEKRYLHKLGHIVWIVLNVAVVRDDDGEPLYFIVQIQDISDRKAADIALRESLARYRMLAENSSDLIATQTLEGVYLYVSPTCQRLLGYPPEALVGRSIFEFLHPEDADALQRLRSITGQFPAQFIQSYRMRRPDGTYIWLETTYQLSNHLEDRHTQLIVSISRDITERKQAETAIVTLNQKLERELIDRRSKLKAVNRLYRAAINSVQEVIFQTDKTGRWTFLSPAWEEITNFSIEQSLNTYFYDWVYPYRDQKRVNILFQDLIDGRRETLRYEFRTPTQNGGFRWLEMFAQIDADEDQPTLGIYGTLNDITDRKQAETLLKSRADELLKQQHQIELQNLQLQEAARIKSQFMATMSHELRTPLNAIMGFSQLLQTQKQGILSQRQQDMVDRIFNNSRNLLEMLNEVLDFSRLEVGSIEINPTPLDVGSFVRLVTEELRSLAEKKNLTLDVNLTIANSQIIGDRNALRRVLINLIANAIKFTETGGVTVGVREAGSERVAITVTDTGIGIASDNIEQIFEAFHQVDRTLARKYSGTGLGLAIAKTLVELMEGEISVESQVDRGSTFCVEIPRRLSSPS
jgi:PAS domain S-box-containing protein